MNPWGSVGFSQATPSSAAQPPAAGDEPEQPRAGELHVQGLRVRSETWVGGEQPMLLLHGLGGNSITWHAVGRQLASDHSATVTAIDLPGFGATHPMGRRLSMALLARIVDEVTRQLCTPGQRIALVGNSLGGLLALQQAARRPDSVAWIGLASLSLPLLWGRDARGVARLSSLLACAVPGVGRRLICRYVQATGVPGVVDDPVRELFYDSASLHPTIRQRLIAVSEFRLGWAHEAARAYEQTARGLGRVLLAASAERASWLDVSCSVVSVYGSHDPLFPLSAWQVLHRRCPDWSHVRLENVGHVPQLEAPTSVLQALRTARAGSS